MPDDEPDTSTPDLSTATTPELIAELKRRSEAMALAWFPTANQTDRPSFETHGGRYFCQGMLDQMLSDMRAGKDGDDDG